MEPENTVRGEFSVELLRRIFGEVFNPALAKRRQVMYTGAYGYDKISESVETYALGTYRLYMGKKIPRILWRVGNIQKSAATDRYYRLLKIKD